MDEGHSPARRGPIGLVLVFLVLVAGDTDRLEEARTHWRRVIDTLVTHATPPPLADQARLALGYLRLDRIEQASALTSELEEFGFRHPITNELRQEVGAREVD